MTATLTQDDAAVLAQVAFDITTFHAVIVRKGASRDQSRRAII
jgi:hypothetical protein